METSEVGNLKICRCCLEQESDLKNLWWQYENGGVCETYGEMLTSCFNLPWEKPPDNDDNEHICDNCIRRLRNAFNFKIEILYSYKIMLEKIKNVTDNVSDNEMEIEYLNVEYLEDDGYNENFLYENVSNDGKNEDDAGNVAQYLDEDDSNDGQNLDEDDSNYEQTNNNNANPIIKKAPRASINGKRYTEEDLQRCMRAVTEGNMTMNKAAILYNIPSSSLRFAFAKLRAAQETVESKIIRANPVLRKIQKNLDNIIKYTNATPFKVISASKYCCHFCTKQYKRPQDLKNHTIQDHLMDRKLRVAVRHDLSLKLDLTDLLCTVCKQNVDSLESALKHINLVHNEETFTDTKKNLLVPFKFDGDVLKCAICFETFPKFKILNDHMNMKHYFNYKCAKCGRGFISRKSWKEHSTRHETGVFHCQFCPKVFTARIHRIVHERMVHVHKNRRYKCGYCSEKFIGMPQKMKHESKIHNAPQPEFPCGECNKSYKNKSSLRVHVREVHLRLRKHKCTDCDFSTNKLYKLKDHMKKHVSQNYKCTVCSKTFGSNSSLRTHMRNHVNHKPFKCEYCQEGFALKCSWQKHLQVKHG